MTMGAIQANDLVKTFGKKRAVDGLTVAFGENRITGLIGRNGAGKTTLLKLIAGYYKPTSGDIRVFGLKPFNSPAVSCGMIFVDDAMGFPQALNLADISAQLRRFYPNFDRALYDALLDYFGLDQRLKPARLSKGQRSTLYTVIGIAVRAPLTIFDEPTTGMDAAVRKDFYRLLLKEYIACPRTVILSSHLLGELKGLLEEIVLIDSGRLVDVLRADEAETCAIGVRGNPQAAAQLTGGKPVLHREELAAGIVTVVIRAALSAEETARAHALGLELQPVSVDDLCIYLTQNGRGGIDDALKRA
jgi:ABC-2 type transport system ATP-binding protein